MRNAKPSTRPLHRWVWILAFILGALSCALADGLDDARRNYRVTQDYASLQLLSAHLKKGMSSEQTEALLGIAGYSPIDGVYMYSSNRKEFVKEASGDLYVYLVLNFRDSKEGVTNELQEWTFAPLGE